MDGTAPAPLDATAARTKGARSLRRATRREDVGDLCAGPVSPPTAGSHCLNRLPVHRSVLVAGRRGQAASGEPTIDIGYAPEWPTFMLATRSRRCGRHLIPSRVIIKRHRRTLRARAGYCPDYCHAGVSVPQREQLSGRLCEFQHAAKRLGRRGIGERFPGACDSIAGTRRGGCVAWRTGCGPAFRARPSILAVPADVGACLTAIRYQQGQGERDAAHGALGDLQRPGNLLRGCRWFCKRQMRTSWTLLRSRFLGRGHN